MLNIGFKRGGTQKLIKSNQTGYLPVLMLHESAACHSILPIYSVKVRHGRAIGEWLSHERTYLHYRQCHSDSMCGQVLLVIMRDVIAMLPGTLILSNR